MLCCFSSGSPKAVVYGPSGKPLGRQSYEYIPQDHLRSHMYLYASTLDQSVQL